MPTKERKAGLPSTTVGGQTVAAYDQQTALYILEQMATGRTLKDICAEAKMPSRQTFHRWVVMDGNLARSYKAAKELSALAFEEEALTLARRLHEPNDFTGTQVRAYEVAMAQYRWSAARRDPTNYGQTNQPLTVVPIQINTSLDLGAAGGGGRSAPDHPDVYQIEAKVVPSFGDPLAVPEKATDDLGVTGSNNGKRVERKKRYKPGASADPDISPPDPTIDD